MEHSNYSTASESDSNTSLELLSERFNKNKNIGSQTKLVHPSCYVSNALTHILKYRFRVQPCLISILLDKLSINDCRYCLNDLMDTCFYCINDSNTFNRNVNLALQIFSIIGSKDTLDSLKDILNRYKDDEPIAAYWNLSLFNIKPEKLSQPMINSLLLNHFNYKTKTKYQEAFDKLLGSSPSLWWKIFRSMHSDCNFGKFNDKNIQFYINTINYYTENEYNNYTINGLFTAITHSLIKYISENACYNYFDIRNLFKGLYILFNKFGKSVLKGRKNLIVLLYNKLDYYTCSCDTDIFCASFISLKKELQNFATYVADVVSIKNVPRGATPEKNSTDTKVVDTKAGDTNAVDTSDYVQSNDLSPESILSTLDYSINRLESLLDMKRIFSFYESHITDNKELEELLQRLKQKYNELNDRGDIHLCISAESLYDDFGLRPWVRFPELCDCP